MICSLWLRSLFDVLKLRKEKNKLDKIIRYLGITYDELDLPVSSLRDSTATFIKECKSEARVKQVIDANIYIDVCKTSFDIINNTDVESSCYINKFKNALYLDNIIDTDLNKEKNNNNIIWLAIIIVLILLTFILIFFINKYKTKIIISKYFAPNY